MRRPARHPLLCIVPPHLLAHLALQRDPRLRDIADRALRTLLASEQFRGARSAVGGLVMRGPASAAGKQRIVFDAAHGGVLPGRRVRGEGDQPAGDPAVNEAFDGLGATWDLFFEAYARNSIDGRGARLDASVHYRVDFDNAFWDGRQMVFGDGDGVIFERFTKSVDVIGHELAHAVTQHAANLVYEGQPGALNEHVSDVFGSLVKQKALGQAADQADWLIGAGLFAPGVRGRALRSMKNPGTAYDDRRIGRDPQPAHMRDYVDTPEDNGGVHINSGIPNRAFCLAALAFGGPAWERAGRVWYLALTEALGPRSDFEAIAKATSEIAGREFGRSAATTVADAWRACGVAPAPPRPRPAPPRRKGAHLADQRVPERRVRRATAGTRG